MKHKLFLLVFIAVILAAAEAGLSTLMLYRYRAKGVVRDGRSIFSLASAGEKLLARLGLSQPFEDESSPYEFQKEAEPYPFLTEDSTFGYRAVPGTYWHYYERRLKNSKNSPWQRLKLKVTVHPDGTRDTGRSVKEEFPNLYILGDSFVFGSGVNDEQTFAYNLQSVRPDFNVRLFALGGYGLSQSYRRAQQLKSQMNARDIVIIGYADFLDHRNVAAPSWLRDRTRIQETQKGYSGYRKVLKAQVDDAGEITFSTLDEDCSKNGDYCRQENPSKDKMTAVSAALINGIARMTPGRVYLLHTDGQKDNPVIKMLDPKIKVISVLPGDFDSFVRDDIAGFDAHPGPYWHYAVAQKIKAQLDLDLKLSSENS